MCPQYYNHDNKIKLFIRQSLPIIWQRNACLYPCTNTRFSPYRNKNDGKMCVTAKKNKKTLPKTVGNT